jgi:magnesium transporter
MHGKLFNTPGTPVFVGEQRRERAQVDFFVYDSESVREVTAATSEDWREAHRSGFGVLWININAIHDVALIEALGEQFGLHPLTIEDIVNTSHRPKWEEFPGYGFLALKMVERQAAGRGVSVEHVTLILGDRFVLSFLEDEGDVFESVRDRIRRGAGRVRRMGADYLAFCLVDAAIDHYFLAVESIGDWVEHFESRLLANAMQVELGEIYRFKRELLEVRRAVWPLREVLSAINRSESPLLQPENQVFWRDLYDHAVQVMDMVENARESMASMHDTYLSSLSNRMNEVMKVLTIISTIFIPLTFIAGIYGMNFKNMPELEWRDGYFVILGIMVAIAVALVVYFRRQRWL